MALPITQILSRAVDGGFSHLQIAHQRAGEIIAGTATGTTVREYQDAMGWAEACARKAITLRLLKSSSFNALLADMGVDPDVAAYLPAIRSAAQDAQQVLGPWVASQGYTVETVQITRRPLAGFVGAINRFGEGRSPVDQGRAGDLLAGVSVPFARVSHTGTGEEPMLTPVPEDVVAALTTLREAIEAPNILAVDYGIIQ